MPIIKKVVRNMILTFIWAMAFYGAVTFARELSPGVRYVEGFAWIIVGSIVILWDAIMEED